MPHYSGGYRFCPPLHPGRCELLANRFWVNPTYYRQAVTTRLPDYVASIDGATQTADVTAAIHAAYGDDDAFAFSPAADEFPGDYWSALSVIAFALDSDPLGAYSSIAIAEATVTAWIVWRMYQLALCDTVKRLTHFHSRGRT